MHVPTPSPAALGARTLALATLLGLAAAPGCMTDDPVTGAPIVPVFTHDAEPLDGLALPPSDAGDDGDSDDGADLADLADQPDATDTDVETGDDCNLDGVADPGEECDDGNTSNQDFCLNTCRLACGDGVVNAVERCDTAIPGNQEGACPTDCDDSEACTADVLSGADCDAHCVHQPITARVDDDGCCPTGAGPATDSDCGAICGNGVVEPPAENCDTAIDSNEAGACPATCSDGLACTADELLDGGTCRARCRFPAINEVGPDDGCCPPGATPATDPNCQLGCGNGTVDPGETCDTAIPTGSVGACPVSCPSDQACRVRELIGADTCTAACTDTFITEVGPDDGCCPAGGNANTDPDCEPECGNGVTEEGEECDDGPDLPTDTCDAFCHLLEPPPTAFRFDAIGLRAPHVFADIPFLGCQDATGTVNGLIDDAVTQDGDDDGLLDLNVMLVFRPLVQTPPGGELDVALGECSDETVPLCTLDPDVAPQRVDYTNQTAGTCLAPIPGTFATYVPGIASVTGSNATPCFVTADVSLTLAFGGVQLPLEDTAVAANYAGNPAASLENGLLRGFMSEEAATAVILPADLPVVGGQNLASILPGATDCSARDERVTDGPPDDATTGWWFYLNFTAEEADLSE